MKRYDMMIKIRDYYSVNEPDLAKRYKILKKNWYYKKAKLEDIMLHFGILTFDNINYL